MQLFDDEMANEDLDDEQVAERIEKARQAVEEREEKEREAEEAKREQLEKDAN